MLAKIERGLVLAVMGFMSLLIVVQFLLTIPWFAERLVLLQKYEGAEYVDGDFQ